MLSAICFTENGRGFAVGGYNTGVGGFIISTTDAGSTWNEHPSGTQSQLLDVTFLDSENGHTVGQRGAILKTTNGGSSWLLQNSGTANDLYSIAFHNDTSGFITGDGGTILTYDKSGTTQVRSAEIAASQFTLLPSYPNPFGSASPSLNSVTSIPILLPYSGRVTLRITDVLGRDIADVFSGHLAVGLHTFRFNAHSLPTGFYQYTVLFEGKARTMRMLIIN